MILLMIKYNILKIAYRIHESKFDLLEKKKKNVNIVQQEKEREKIAIELWKMKRFNLSR